MTVDSIVAGVDIWGSTVAKRLAYDGRKGVANLEFVLRIQRRRVEEDEDCKNG